MSTKLAQSMTIEPHNEITFHGSPPLFGFSARKSLEFAGPYTDVVESTLKLTNTNAEAMAFKVKTTAPKQYCVRPNSGFIEPNESRDVVGESIVTVSRSIARSDAATVDERDGRRRIAASQVPRANVLRRPKRGAQH